MPNAGKRSISFYEVLVVTNLVIGIVNSIKPARCAVIKLSWPAGFEFFHGNFVNSALYAAENLSYE
jgi:hypothetical protein